MTAWIFQTRFGTLCIAPSRSHEGGWDLWRGDRRLGSYDRPEAAAHDVAKRATGDAELDRNLGWWTPADLGEWQRAER